MASEHQIGYGVNTASGETRSDGSQTAQTVSCTHKRNQPLLSLISAMPAPTAVEGIRNIPSLFALEDTGNAHTDLPSITSETVHSISEQQSSYVSDLGEIFMTPSKTDVVASSLLLQTVAKKNNHRNSPKTSSTTVPLTTSSIIVDTIPATQCTTSDAQNSRNEDVSLNSTKGGANDSRDTASTSGVESMSSLPPLGDVHDFTSASPQGLDVNYRSKSIISNAQASITETCQSRMSSSEPINVSTVGVDSPTHTTPGSEEYRNQTFSDGLSHFSQQSAHKNGNFDTGILSIAPTCVSPLKWLTSPSDIRRQVAVKRKQIPAKIVASKQGVSDPALSQTQNKSIGTGVTLSSTATSDESNSNVSLHATKCVCKRQKNSDSELDEKSSVTKAKSNKYEYEVSGQTHTYANSTSPAIASSIKVVKSLPNRSEIVHQCSRPASDLSAPVTRIPGSAVATPLQTQPQARQTDYHSSQSMRSDMMIPDTQDTDVTQSNIVQSLTTQSSTKNTPLATSSVGQPSIPITTNMFMNMPNDPNILIQMLTDGRDHYNHLRNRYLHMTETYNRAKEQHELLQQAERQLNDIEAKFNNRTKKEAELLGAFKDLRDVVSKVKVSHTSAYYKRKTKLCNAALFKMTNIFPEDVNLKYIAFSMSGARVDGPPNRDVYIMKKGGDTVAIKDEEDIERILKPVMPPDDISRSKGVERFYFNKYLANIYIAAINATKFNPKRKAKVKARKIRYDGRGTCFGVDRSRLEFGVDDSDYDEYETISDEDGNSRGMDSDDLGHNMPLRSQTVDSAYHPRLCSETFLREEEEALNANFDLLMNSPSEVYVAHSNVDAAERLRDAGMRQA
eukprot:CFRG1226T1